MHRRAGHDQQHGRRARSPGFKLTVLSVAGLLGEAIKRINGGESVSSLFEINGKGDKDRVGLSAVSAARRDSREDLRRHPVLFAGQRRREALHLREAAARRRAHARRAPPDHSRPRRRATSARAGCTCTPSARRGSISSRATRRATGSSSTRGWCWTMLDDIRPDIIESGDPYHLAWTALRAGTQLHAPVFGFYHSHFPEAYLRTALKYGGRWLRDAVLSYAEDYIVKLYSQFTATLVPSRAPAAAAPRMGRDQHGDAQSRRRHEGVPPRAARRGAARRTRSAAGPARCCSTSGGFRRRRTSRCCSPPSRRCMRGIPNTLPSRHRRRRTAATVLPATRHRPAR